MRTCVIQPVLGQGTPGRDPEDALSEALSLVRALDVELTETIRVNLPKVQAGQFFGSGKVKEVKASLNAAEIDLVVVNGTLSPVQQRNLETAWGVKVLDRTALILEIFGERARTREGVLQVDLAALSYQRSRLVRSWTHLERQRGGGGFMGGPGERQIESDRRAIANAIIQLKRQLEKVVKTRELHRASRRKIPYPIIALVGYTNAGKSSIFNQLTGASVLQKDMLFATLDPTMRAIELPGGQQVILSDTVGFISDLPTQLIAAFRATLEEVLEADILIHVRDISHAETEFQAENVHDVLGELGVEEHTFDKMIEVWNKTDLLNENELETTRNSADRQQKVVLTSAIHDTGLDDLTRAIEGILTKASLIETFDLESDIGRRRAWLYENCNVISEEQDGDKNTITVQLSAADKSRFEALSKS